MPYLYLLTTQKININTPPKKIIVICIKDMLRSVSIGGKTNLLGKNNIYQIIGKSIVFLDIPVYNSIVRKKYANSICSAHSVNQEMYITIDNNIWNIGFMNGIGKELTEYKKVIFL